MQISLEYAEFQENLNRIKFLFFFCFLVDKYNFCVDF